MCRWGRRELDGHAALAEAIEHVFELAGEHRPSEVFVHHADGRVCSQAVFEPPPS